MISLSLVKTFPLGSRIKLGCSVSIHLSAQYSVESLSQSNRAEERNVKHSSWKRISLTLPICRRMILQIVNSIKIPPKTIRTNK